MTIAKTILEQLGGHKFVVMTGARNLGDGGNYLGFRIGRNQTRANYVKITLEPMDWYTVEFIAIRKFTTIPLRKFEQVHCDQLAKVFEEFTGLRTRL